MAKMTKTQQKRAYLAIKQKARRLWEHGVWAKAMSTQDMLTIHKICDKYLKKF